MTIKQEFDITLILILMVPVIVFLIEIENFMDIVFINGMMEKFFKGKWVNDQHHGYGIFKYNDRRVYKGMQKLYIKKWFWRRINPIKGVYKGEWKIIGKMDMEWKLELGKKNLLNLDYSLFSSLNLLLVVKMLLI